MLKEYKDRVLFDYQKKKENGTLSNNLIDPSPGRLRDECLIVYHERPNPKDDEILRLFFTSKNNNYSHGIKSINVDKFRPLVNWLNEKIDNPSDRNVQLLAWLINFEPRPYQFGQLFQPLVIESKPEVIIPTTHEPPIPPSELPSTTPDPEVKPPPFLLRFKTISVIVLGMMMIGIAVQGFYKFNAEPTEMIFNPILTGKEQCMYWTGVNYRPISCSQKIGDTAVIGIDKKRLFELKKIMRPDTLTSFSLGKVWYAKIKGQMEYYTAGGEHPVDNNRRLLPLTPYMLNKYHIDEQ